MVDTVLFVNILCFSLIMVHYKKNSTICLKEIKFHYKLGILDIIAAMQLADNIWQI